LNRHETLHSRRREFARRGAVYRELTADLGFPAHFGHNPDALWDALSEQRAEPVEIVWRHSARSAERLGPAFDRIVAVLHRAAAEGLVRLELS
jgi:RNAse (barnase) inhibitor barstar